MKFALRSSGARLARGVACACVLAGVSLAPGPAEASAAVSAPLLDGKPIAQAMLDQCLTSPEASERSVTFAGEMSAIPGSVRMQMRIDVLERLPGQSSFHVVAAPGLGVWRSSLAGVKVYKYLKQVSNLSAPAIYRGAVRFRWLNSKGRLMRALELLTPRCQQPAATSESAPA